MSQLDILKEQMEAMEQKILTLKSNIERSKVVVNNLEQDKQRIDNELSNASIKHDTLVQNYNYLTEVHKETMNNYNQIEDAATTLLDIIKSKCDNVS